MRAMLNGRIVSVLFAIVASLCTSVAAAGSLHPDLESRLAALPPGAQVPVIVELTTKADPKSAAKSAGEFQRRARGRAVVETLRDVAARTQPAVKEQLSQDQASGDVSKVKAFWVFNGLAVTANEKAIRRLAKRDDVREVRLDVSIPPPRPTPSATPSTSSADPAWNIAQIRAPDVWALGRTGAGAVVGSFDTGVEGTHPDLAPRYRGNDAISWFDPYGQHASPYDNNGHGTHTTGTMVGGDLSGQSIGVAPGARWIAAKAWDDADNATESAFHQIFEWFLAPGGDPANAPDVVNSSWGLDPALCFTDFQADVQALRAAGIVPVFAAGNGGPDPGTVLAPGSYAESYAVGSTDFFDDISYFSSQGPSPCDGAIKPNISAPGEFILSTFPGGNYAFLDGTSMATPHVSGAAAVLLSIDPTMTVDEVEAAISAGAVDLGTPGADNAFGYGRLDLAESARLVLGIEKVGVVATNRITHESGTLPGVFTVSRTGATDAALTLTYTVSGTATSGSDYLALPGSVAIPIGSSSATIVVTPIHDGIYELDETVIVTLDPIPNFVVSPKTATVTIVSDELPPDLVISAMSAPANAAPGATITVTDTTRNQGTGAAQASTTRYYLSTNNVLDAGDVMLGSRPIPALAAGDMSTGTVTLTIPAGTAGGVYYLFANADADDAVLESQEGNNLFATNITIAAVLPDLTITSFTAPATSGAGATISVTDTTKNQGAGAAPSSTTRYYLSANNVLDAGDVMLGGRAVAALAAGASDAGTVTLTIPASTAAGTYYLFAKADGDDAIAETQESNNLYATTITIGADLIISSLTVPNDGGAGLSITIADTTRNQGVGMAIATTTRYYLSTDAVLDAGDVVLGSRAVPALAAGASDTGSLTVTIPAATTAGLYYVFAKADALDVVSEVSEVNNTLYRNLRVGPDLLIASFTAPASTGAGATISVTDTTRNQGAGSAAASTTRYYLSTNNIFDAGDVMLGGRAVPALAPGASDTGTATLTIPSDASGSYYLFAKADGDNVVAESEEGNNLFATNITIGADLVISSLTVPSDGGAGQALTLTDTTRNQGAGAAAASTTSYYLSVDAALDGSDVLLGSRAVPALAASTSSTGSVTVTIPAGTATGTYYVFAQADAGNVVSEVSEANNTAFATVRVGPDLSVTNLVAPATTGAGVAISVTDTTRNLGAGASPASTTRFYLSFNNVLDAGDTLLGGRAVAALAPGASDTGTVSLTIPAGMASGTYYLFAKADGDDAIVETQEGNNLFATNITIGADLIIENLTVPTDGGAGLPITLTDTTKNQSSATAAASTTSYYLSTDALLDGGDVLLGGRAVPSLAANASDTGSVTVTIPAGTATGTYYLFAKADSGNVVSEVSEVNNTTYRTLRVGPDLLIASFTVPATAGAGTTISVTDTTRNQGGGTAAASNTRYYLSANNVLDGGDTLLGSRAVALLAPGASDTGSATLSIPSGITSGTYYLFAKADGDDAIAETQEFNNLYAAVITIGSDLVIQYLTVPTDGGAGYAITITDTTRNQGAGTTAPSTTSYYLSTDAALDGGDILLGSRAVPALASGVSDTGSVTVVIPTGTPTGNYYVFAKADSGNVVSEVSEANNTAFRSIRVGPDLLIASFSAPASAVAGSTVTITDTTRNQGGGAAAASNTRYYLSFNNVIDASDVLLGARVVPPLAPGASDTGSSTVTIPLGTPRGAYYLFAKADGDDALTETLEYNNLYAVIIQVQ